MRHHVTHHRPLVERMLLKLSVERPTDTPPALLTSGNGTGSACLSGTAGCRLHPEPRAEADSCCYRSELETALGPIAVCSTARSRSSSPAGSNACLRSECSGNQCDAARQDNSFLMRSAEPGSDRWSPATRVTVTLVRA